MPRVGLEHTIAVCVRAKTVHALDHEATIIDERTIAYTQVAHAHTHKCLLLTPVFLTMTP
jgi:hypothetical protein